jgi:predicted ATPase
MHNLREAELLFRESMDIARLQGALAFELRAAMSLVHLGTRRKDTTALANLSLIYNQFKEGFDTPDLREARLWLATSHKLEKVS